MKAVADGAGGVADVDAGEAAGLQNPVGLLPDRSSSACMSLKAVRPSSRVEAVRTAGRRALKPVVPHLDHG